MSEVTLPDPIDCKYLTGMTPPISATVAVAQHLNRIIEYLASIEGKLKALPDFTKPLKESS